MISFLKKPVIIKRICLGYPSGMRKIKSHHVRKTANHLALRPQEANSQPPAPPPCLPPSPTHVLTAPPQLAQLRFGPAQLRLKVQDFVLGCSFLGSRVLLGLVHLPRRHGVEGGAYRQGEHLAGRRGRCPCQLSRTTLHIATETELFGA